MPELEEIELEYRELSARVTYASFDGAVDPADERHLEELADLRVRLSAPDFAAAE
jgi:hypothetical protein